MSTISIYFPSFTVGQKVTWVRKSPWPPLHCEIEQVYGREARIRYYAEYYGGKPFFNYKYAYVSLKKLLPGHIKGLNDEELKKLLNPKYKHQTKVKPEDDDEY